MNVTARSIFAAVLTATVLAGPVTALADGRNDRHEWRDDHRDDRNDRHDRGHDRHQSRNDHRDDRRDEWRHERRWDERDFRQGYRYGERDQQRFERGRYDRPYGYHYHSWRRGDRLPMAYCGPRYIVNDYYAYRLRAPPRGHRWVRVDNDVVLAAVTSGIVVSVVSGLFY
jgi:Ni/Co efflux regulator RcnB